LGYKIQLHNFITVSNTVRSKLIIQSNLSTTPKKRPLFRGGRYSKVSRLKLQLVWDVWGSGWPLLTGGRCSEVAVNTGLTVLSRMNNSVRISFNIFDLQAKQQKKTRFGFKETFFQYLGNLMQITLK
jgi:hypothetical protein